MATMTMVDVLKRFKSNQDTFNANKFVAKETGKSLVSDTEITKLATVAEGAQVNVIESVAVKNENIVSVTDKGVQIDLTAYAKSTDYTSALMYKGTVDTYSALPAENNQIGDVWNITAADAAHNINVGDNVAWNGTSWDNLAGVVDLSGKVDKETGKSLLADTEITRLAGIAAGAQVNVIESISVDGTALSVTDKGVNIDLSGKVDKVEGSSLMTSTQAEQLAALVVASNDDIDGIFTVA